MASGQDPKSNASTMDKLGECPICFSMFNLEILQDHTNDCLDNSQLSIKGLPSPSGSTSSEKFFSPPRKRPHTDLSAWVTTNRPKALNTSPSSNASHDVATDKARAEEIVVISDTETISNDWQHLRFPIRNLNNSLQQPGASTSNNPAKNGVGKSATNSNVPLAEKMRPKALSEFVGQEKIIGEASLLRTLIAKNDIPSMILWGPPGCGKTSLASIIAAQCKQTGDSKFVKLSATSSGVNEVKEAIKIAKTDMALWKRKTILFIDEIHRFNKLQQDTFLPYVENGTIILVGATTENPSFSLNSALLSRCRVFVLEKLSSENIKDILLRAMEQLNVHCIEADQEKPMALVCMERDAIDFLAHMSDGDARTALNGLHLAMQADKLGSDVKTSCTITVELIKESLQRSHLLYDRKGEEHYNCISALHKSMRGNDANASLYWLGRMLEGGEDPLYVARRLVRFASEDIGLADPGALTQAVAAYQACQCIGMPECDVILAQCVVYLAEAQKSVRVYNAYSKVKQCIHNHAGPLPGVPLHLRNAPTKLMKDLGYSKGYKYNPNYKGPVQQDYMPEGLENKRFLDTD